MKLTTQKRLAARVLKVGAKRVWFDPDRLTEIKEAITKADIRKLIASYAIQAHPEKGISRGRTRKNRKQRRKGRQAGLGSRKGTKFARLPKKEAWMSKIRAQRNFIRDLKGKQLIDVQTFRDIYLKCKGGFFRSVRHIKTYLTEHELFRKK